jgi:hypothetical protein
MKYAVTLIALAAICLAAPVATAATACGPGDLTIVTDCSNLPVAVSGQPYTAQLTTVGCAQLTIIGGGGGVGGGCDVFWSASNLPTGLSISPMGESTVITGSPSVTGDFDVTITATDLNALNGIGCETSCTGTISVVADISTVPPQYQTLGNTQATYFVQLSPNENDDHSNDCMISTASPAGAFAALGAALLAVSLAFLRRR